MKSLICGTAVLLSSCVIALAFAAGASERTSGSPSSAAASAPSSEPETKSLQIGIDLTGVKGLASKNAEILRTVFGRDYVAKPRAEVVLSVDRTKRPAEVSVRSARVRDLALVDAGSSTDVTETGACSAALAAGGEIRVCVFLSRSDDFVRPEAYRNSDPHTREITAQVVVYHAIGVDENCEPRIGVPGAEGSRSFIVHDLTEGQAENRKNSSRPGKTFLWKLSPTN
jgi:hypothetical protein